MPPTAPSSPARSQVETALRNYKKAINKGLLKVFSKMGISTLQSYRGAQVFEAIGLNRSLVDKYFTGTTSRINGIGLDVIAEESRRRHAFGMRRVTGSELELSSGGDYRFRVNGEYHLLNPQTISKLQHAVRQSNLEKFHEFTSLINEQNRQSRV